MLAFFPMIDPAYLILVGLPTMLLGIWAQAAVKRAYARASRIPNRVGYTGAQAARAILQDAGIHDVDIEPSRGMLSDHYDPRHKVLRLSPDVFNGRSLAAVGIAAHEAGHAIQHAHAYAPLAIRNGLVPMAAIGSNLAFAVFFLGLFISAANLMTLGVALFATVVLFQLVNLPVEFNASARAKAQLASLEIGRAHV